MVTRQREYQVTCSGSDSPSLLALPDPEHDITMTRRNVWKHTNNRTPRDVKSHFNYTSHVRLGLPFLQVSDQTSLCVSYLCHACYTATHITESSHSKTDRQIEASTECRSAQFSSLSGRLPAGDPHRRLPLACSFLQPRRAELCQTTDTSVRRL